MQLNYNTIVQNLKKLVLFVISFSWKVKNRVLSVRTRHLAT